MVRALGVLLCGGAIAMSSSGCHVGLLGILVGAGLPDDDYRAGILAKELGDASVRSVGCLDVGLMVAERPAPAPRDGNTILTMYVGNRCETEAAFDFAKVLVEATDRDERAIDVALEDPRREIEKLHVVSRARGKANMRLSPSSSIARVCFHVDAVAAVEHSTSPPTLAPICWARRDGADWNPSW